MPSPDTESTLDGVAPPVSLADERSELARSVERLVRTLALARDSAARGVSDHSLASIVARARRELDLADEHLLVLDRHRQRSAFRQAERIRVRLDTLEAVIASRSDVAADAMAAKGPEVPPVAA